MNLVSRKNFLIFLAAILVVAFGYMALTLTKQMNTSKTKNFEKEINMMQSQSQSDNVNDIEKDLKETDFSDVDSELHEIDKELNQAY